MEGTRPEEAAPYVYKYMWAHATSTILTTAANFEVFDTIHNVGGEAKAKTVAEKAGTSVDGMERLLAACVEMKLMNSKILDDGTSVFSNTEEASLFLRQASGRCMLSTVAFMTGPVRDVLEHLDEAVINGKSVVSGKSMKYENLGDDEIDSRAFQLEKALAALCHASIPFTTAFDFSEFKKLIDIQGTGGQNAKQMKAAYPHMDVSVLENESFFHRMEVQHIFLDDGPITYIHGDLFTELPQADLFLLSYILHNWNEKECNEILQNVYNALPSGGGILVLEKILDEDNHAFPLAAILDMLMLVMFDGRERTKKSYTALLQANGFTDVQCRVLNGSNRDVIFARKPNIENYCTRL